MEGLIQQLKKRKNVGNYRQLKHAHSLIDFASNDYLGLSRSAQLKKQFFYEFEKAMQENPDKGIGSTGSRLLTGNTSYAERLEEQLAHFHEFEAGLLFSCGYMANVGLLSSVAKNEDVIFFDARIHASMRDGIRLSRARSFPFYHNDLDHLETRLRNVVSLGSRFVCIESVYSTDGSLSPLEEISSLCIKYGAHLIVDEAHAVGVFGPLGKGLTAEKKITNRLFAQVTTFGKALGAYGAIVLGSKVLKDYLLNFAHSAIYTTALPLHCLSTIKCAYEILPSLEKERSHLHSLKWQTVFSPIQAIKIPGNAKVQECARFLTEEGFDVRPLVSPTVKRGEESLRVCLHAFNTMQQVRRLKKCIDSL